MIKVFTINEKDDNIFERVGCAAAGTYVHEESPSFIKQGDG